MAVPKMSRHDMKQDELVTAVEQFGGYLGKHPTTVRNGGLVGAAVLAVGVGLYLFLQNRAASASDLLLQGQARFSGRITPDAPNPAASAPSFASEADRDRAALESFDALAASYSGRREGRLALYYRGILLARMGRADEAGKALEEFISRAPSEVLAATAKAQLAQIHASQGQLDVAAKAYSELAEETNGAFPRDWALYYLAQTLEQQGKAGEAQAAYKKLASEFPNSPMSYEAGKRTGGTPASDGPGRNPPTG